MSNVTKRPEDISQADFDLSEVYRQERERRGAKSHRIRASDESDDDELYDSTFDRQRELNFD